MKLICGFIFSSPEVIQQAVQRLQVQLGPIDIQSEMFLFSHTEYYQREMGKSLGRLFLSFARLIRRERLAEIKLLTNGLEENLSHVLKGKSRRQINIDPGYLEASKLVLASTKNFSHRIYLSRGIYAEVTLQYRQNRFQPLPWTYPDYQTPQVLSFLLRARQVYMKQISEAGVS